MLYNDILKDLIAEKSNKIKKLKNKLKETTNKNDRELLKNLILAYESQIDGIRQAKQAINKYVF